MPKQRPTFNTKRPSSASLKALDDFVVNDEPESDVQTAEEPSREEEVDKLGAQRAAKRRAKKVRSSPGSPAGPRSRGVSRRADGTERRRLSVYLTPELYKKAKLHAVDLEMSLSEWVAGLVQHELQKQ